MSDGKGPTEPLSEYVGRGMREVGAAWEALVDDRDKEIAILRAQRLNLLTALRGVVDIIDHGGPHALAPGHICGPDAFCDQDCAGVSYEQETLADARAAIANARGGA